LFYVWTKIFSSVLSQLGASTGRPLDVQFLWKFSHGQMVKPDEKVCWFIVSSFASEQVEMILLKAFHSELVCKPLGKVCQIHLRGKISCIFDFFVP
jgi:hypothetical protein